MIPHLPARRFFECAVFACLAVSALPLGGFAAEAGPVTREAVLESLKFDGPAWAEKIRTTSPRLYFSEAEWARVRKEIDGLAGSRADLRAAFFEKVDGILGQPLPIYQSPEKMVETHAAKSLYSAMEELWQREVGDNIFALALAAKLRPEPRYTSKLHDLVMAALAFDTWGKNKLPMGDNADLAAGHLTRGISVAYDWHRGIFSEEEQKRIRRTMSERVPNLLRGLYGAAFWARGYEENHNHVSVTGLAFSGLAFYDEIPEAPEWLAAARLNFRNVIASLPADGSSVEGVSYWTYGIGYILQYIEGTRRIIDSADLYDSQFLRNAAAFRLMASTSGFEGNVPWGDAVTKDWGSPQFILHGLAAQYGDANAAWLAANLANPFHAGIDGLGLSMLWSRKAPEPGSPPSALDARLTANDMVTSRAGWGPGDYTLSIKAGYTNRNHGHLDSGALAIAFGDEWVLIAPGYGKGSGEAAYWDRGKTGRRWEFFSNATESHSALLIDGKNQRSDEKAKAIVTGFFGAPEWSVSTVDLTGVYADVTRVEREVIHRRGDYILVFDSVKAPRSVSVEWLAQFRKETPPEKNGDLLGRGTKGRVLIRLLEPAGAFSLRQPTSPKLDPPKPQFTYAAKATGSRCASRCSSNLSPAGPPHRPSTRAPKRRPMACSISRSPLQLGPITSPAPPPGRTSSFRPAANTERMRNSRRGWPVSARTPEASPLFSPSMSPPCSCRDSYSGPGKLATSRPRKKPDGSWETSASRDIAAEISTATVPAK